MRHPDLKNFSSLNGLKIRLVIDSMTDVVLQDGELNKRTIDLTVEKTNGNENSTVPIILYCLVVYSNKKCDFQAASIVHANWHSRTLISSVSLGSVFAC
jgi:hypothetical protein